MTRPVLLLSTAIMLIGTINTAAAPANPTENKQPEKQEFGAHDRPWARNYLTSGQCETQAVSTDDHAPGLMDSKNKVELRLKDPKALTPAPLDAALADTSAALEAVRRERKRLEQEWKELEDARAVVALASRRTKEELSALSILRTEVSNLIEELEIREDANIERVSDLVKNLNAKDAARLLGTRDAEFIVEILDVLDSRLAADVLGRLDEERAEEVIALIATRGRPEQGSIIESL